MNFSMMQVMVRAHQSRLLDNIIIQAIEIAYVFRARGSKICLFYYVKDYVGA